MRRLEMVSYQREWEQQYKEASKILQALFGDMLLGIHHIGSTSIPGMSAKPIIDILTEVREIGEVDGFNHSMERAGYVPRGENGIPGRRYFVKAEGSRHTHHVHIFECGTEQVRRHLAFRDYLKAHPAEVERYSALKVEIAEEGVRDVKEYQERKNGLVKELQERAEDWVRSGVSFT